MELLHMPIRKTHPTLFRLIMTLSIVNVIIAVALLFGDPQTLINFRQIPNEGIFPPLWFYSILWFLAAFWLVYGLKGNGHYKWTRRGLTLSAMVGGFWSFGFTTAFVQGQILGMSAPLLWSMYAALCVIITSEPVINPLSAAIQNNFGGGSEEPTQRTTNRTKRIRDHD